MIHLKDLNYDPEFAEQIRRILGSTYSDKTSGHQYHPVYAHLLKNRKVETFLEVGLFLNDLPHTDLTGWAELFPDAKFYGADIKSSQFFSTDNITMIYADQSNVESLENLASAIPSTVDVILDDASHYFPQTISTFETLFDKVSDGGIYIIEDILETSVNGNGWQQSLDDFNAYFAQHAVTFEIFDAKHDIGIAEPDLTKAAEEELVIHPSDDFIICIYK
jgi:hypothetical protein